MQKGADNLHLVLLSVVLIICLDYVESITGFCELELYRVARWEQVEHVLSEAHQLSDHMYIATVVNILHCLAIDFEYIPYCLMVVQACFVQEFTFLKGHLLQAHTEIVFNVAEIALVTLQLSLQEKIIR